LLTTQDHDPMDKFVNTWSSPKHIRLLFNLPHNLAIIFTTFYAHALCTCHKHKNTLGPNQTLLHENTSTIKISFCNNLIKCLWMLIWHEINHAMMETYVLQKNNYLWQSMLCSKIWSATHYCSTTEYVK